MTVTRQPPTQRNTLPTLALPLLVGLAALALRLHDLTAQSLWLDEAMSLYWAGLPAGEIVGRLMALSGDPHPPLYYLLLKAWMALFGNGEAAVKGLSLAASLAAVPLLYALGKRLFDRRVALLAALLAAASPLLVWYAQEVRMYSLLATFTLAASLCLWRALENDRPAWWALYALCALAGAYTHLYGALLLPFQGLFAAWVWAGRAGAGTGPQGAAGESTWPGATADENGSARTENGREPNPRPLPSREGASAAGQTTPVRQPRSAPSPFRGGRGERSAVQGSGETIAAGGPFRVAEAFPYEGAGARFARLGGGGGSPRPGAPGQRTVPYLSRLLRQARRGLVAFAAVALLYAPWAWAAWTSSASAYSGRPLMGLPEMVAALLAAFTAHKASVPGVLPAAVGLIRLAGPASLMDTAHQNITPRPSIPRPTSAWVFLALYLVGPLCLVALLSQRYELWGVPYFIVVAPPFLLALAASLDALYRRWTAVGIIALALVLGLAVTGLAANAAPENRKEDWRAAAAYVQSHAAPDDAVLVVADFTGVPFNYYYKGPAPVYTPWGGRIESAAQVEAPLQGLAGANTIWLVQSHQEPIDPQGLIPSVLAQRYPIVTEQYPQGVRVTAYAVRTRLAQAPAGTVSANTDLGPLRLVAFVLDAGGGPYRATDDTYHPPSGWVHVSLYWQAVAPPAQDYTVSVRLLDSIGQVWGDKLDRADAPLRRYPPTHWLAGEVVRDEYDVNLNPATPPGAYRIEVGVLAADGKVLGSKIIAEVRVGE